MVESLNIQDGNFGILKWVERFVIEKKLKKLNLSFNPCEIIITE